MLIIIKSGPDTDESRRAVKLARDTASDLVLLQNAVYLAEKEKLDGFCGTVYALDEDLKLRGIGSIEKGVKAVGYGELIDLMSNGDKVTGMF